MHSLVFLSFYIQRERPQRHFQGGKQQVEMRENQYHLIKDENHLIKDGKYFITNAHYVKSKISVVSAEQAKKHIGPSIVLIKEKLAMRWIGEGKYISWGM